MKRIGPFTIEIVKTASGYAVQTHEDITPGPCYYEETPELSEAKRWFRSECRLCQRTVDRGDA